MAKDIIKDFDTKVMSWWLIIGIGAAKAVEKTLELIANEFIDITLLGMDISVIGMYLVLMFVGLTGLIAWTTLQTSSKA